MSGAGHGGWQACGDQCSGSLVVGGACLRHARPIDRARYLGGCSGRVDARGVELTEDLLGEVLGALAEAPPERRDLRVDGAQFRGVADFRSLAELASVSCVQAEFTGDLVAEGVRFGQLARFRKLICAGDARFSGVRFRYECTFRGAVFLGKASFETSTFAGTAVFEGTRFRSRTAFAESHFLGDASFMGARFSDVADFRKAKFSRGGRFRSAVFDVPPLSESLVRFSEATIREPSTDSDGRSDTVGPMTPDRPRMFIGSSGEGLPVARALQAELEFDADVTIWSQGVFGLSQATLETLTASVREYDFAVLVLTPDDVVTKRDSTQSAPRDNVVFEAGLFIGALGRGRAFFVVNREEAIDLPSDLAGITLAQYRPRLDGNLQAAVGVVATNIRTAMDVAFRSAPAEGPGPDPMPTTTDHSLSNTAAPDDRLPSLLATVDRLESLFGGLPDSAMLRGDQGRIYGALLQGVRDARPRDALLHSLSLPKETAMSGIYSTTVAEATMGLSLMRSALISAD